MIVRAGTPVSFPILFTSGAPDGAVTFQLFDPLTKIYEAETSVPADAVSATIILDGNYNLLSPGSLLSYRDLQWHYSVGGNVITGEQRYSIEARLPYGVSTDGVRAKLGVDKTDLPDSDISLAKAFLSFRDVVTAERLALMPPDSVTITDAIEAQAALSLIPTMAVRVATKESSGTNQFQRQDVDWDAIASHLSSMVSAGYVVADPAYDETANYGALLVVVTPASDAITGA